MRLTKAERDNIRDWTNLFRGITENYECPEECNAGCCSKSSISLSEPEFKKVLRVRKDIKETLTQNFSVSSDIIAGREMKQYEFTVYPCPLLENNKCSIYKIRPIICQMYPFKTNANTVPGHITVDACPVGVQIAMDFIICKTVVNAGPYVTEYTVPEEELNHLKQMLIDSKEYKTDSEVKNIQIPIKFLKPFSDYLAKSKKEMLEVDRQTLLKGIKSLN